MASPIEAQLLLSDAAQVDPAGKVHILGAGWSVTGTPTPPHAVVAFINVPWDRTNVTLPTMLRLVDEDGRGVGLTQPDGTEEPLQLLNDLEVGRPPGIRPGTPIGTSFALNVSPMPLPPGRYTWRLDVAEESFATSFTVMSPPPARAS